MICRLCSALAVLAGLAVLVSVAVAGVPDPTMSSTDGDFMVGNARGLAIVAGLPDVVPTCANGYEVVVNDVGGVPIFGATVTMNFTGTGIRPHAVQSGAQLADCAQNLISLVTDINGRAIFFPAVVGENNSAVPNVQIRANGVLLTTIRFRSMDLIAVRGVAQPGIVNVADLNEFRLRFLSQGGRTNLDPDCDFATEGPSANKVDAFDLNALRTEFLCEPLGVPPLPCSRTQCDVDCAVINEFLVRPHTGDREFVEIFNRCTQSFSLAGWSIEVFNADSSLVSSASFAPGDILPPGGVLVRYDSSFTQAPPPGPGGPRLLRKQAAMADTTDFLFDRGGIVVLRNDAGQVVDRVGYGNLGGALISCPLVVPSGFSPPPGFGGAPGAWSTATAGSAAGIAAAETLSTSTNRVPDGRDTDDDAADFNIGRPSADSSNAGAGPDLAVGTQRNGAVLGRLGTQGAAPPDLGSSIRVTAVNVYPENDDANPVNEAVEFYNPTAEVKDIRGDYISDGLFIQPVFPLGGPAPLEPRGKYTVIAGLNGTSGFEFFEDSRLDLYEQRAEGLVRIDQMGWARVPPFFPDSCLVRVPDGAGPSGGWDWDTSGGYVTLFYVGSCGLSGPGVQIPPGASWRTSLSAPRPNPASGATGFELLVGEELGARVTAYVAIYDVAGRRVGDLGRGMYAPGRYLLTWNGTTGSGRRLASGVYFARLVVGERPVGEVRTAVWLGR